MSLLKTLAAMLGAILGMWVLVIALGVLMHTALRTLDHIIEWIDAPRAARRGDEMTFDPLHAARVRVRTAGIRIVLNSMRHEPAAAKMIERIAHALTDLDAIDRLMSSDATPILPQTALPAKDSACLPS